MRWLLNLTLVAVFALPTFASAEDTKKAARTRKLLQKKISIDLEDERLDDALQEVKDLVRGFTYKLDTRGGVSRNQKVTVMLKNKTVAEVLDKMFKKPGLGYYIISNTGNAYDGGIWVKQGTERGYPKKKKE